MFSCSSVGLISVSLWQILTGPHSVAFAVMTAAAMYCAVIIFACFAIVQQLSLPAAMSYRLQYQDISSLIAIVSVAMTSLMTTSVANFFCLDIV